MAEEENKALMRRYYREVWQDGDFAASEQLVAADIVDHMPMADQAPGRAGHDQTVRMVRAAFPDAQFSIEEVLADGDKVVGRWTMRGTHRGDLMGIPPTGKAIEMAGIDMGRWEGDRLVEIWHIEDIMGMMMQLGVIPGFANS